MGWAIANCIERSRNCCTSSKNLVIEYSPSNNESSNAISSFSQYIRGKNSDIQISTVTSRNQSDIITIEYYSGNKHEIIYSGNNLNQSIFDSLYERIK